MRSGRLVFASLGGLVALAGVLVAVNLVAGVFRARVDLTQERAFTLSEGTRAILAHLQAPVQVRLYAGSAENAMPPFLKNYAAQVGELLEEMRQASGGLLDVRRLDPKPDSDAEESARMDGIEPHPLPNGDVLTLGLSATMLDSKAAIPFLSPDRERLLEYDIARAIAQVSRESKPAVGVMSSLPAMGQPMAALMTGGQGPRPWVLIGELRRDFDVREVPLTARSIPSDLETLVVIHPKDITPETEYAMDQFLMRGGRLVVFLDPYCLFDGGFGPVPQGTRSNLPTLLPAWGLSFDDQQAVADLDFEGRTREGRAPGLLDLGPTALNRGDILTADLDSMLMAFAGAFSGEPPDGIRHDVLIHSSTNSRLVDPAAARMAPEQIIRNFQPSGKEMPLAVRLSGAFPSAFPDGPPDGAEGEHSADPAGDATVVLVGDADMLQDALTVTEVRGLFPGGRMLVPTNGNLAFAQAAIEQLAGGPGLIAVRGRASRNRPFTLVRKMQAAADRRFQSTIRDLEAALEETRARLAQLQQGKEQGRQFILSPEQQREIEAFRAKEAGVRLKLRQTRRELRAEIDALENRLKWLNIAAVPAAVILVGTAFGIWRKRRSRAR
jgi:ABC-type uncharacterized transport system involved in gliding motility auxiliary subunit